MSRGKFPTQNKLEQIEKRIIEIRGGLTRKEFAELFKPYGLKLESSDISKYESGKVKPSTNFYIAVSKMGYNVNWLLTGRGNIKQDIYNYKKNEFNNVAEKKEVYKTENENIKQIIKKEVEKLLKDKK